jgi:hypothetical protein
LCARVAYLAVYDGRSASPLGGKVPRKALAAIGLLVGFALTSCDRITPREMTYTAIGETFYRIHLYAEQNGALPTSLKTLPARPGYMNRITDGWDRPLEYRVQPNGIITLSSYGRDGVPGGKGDDADISVSYRTKRADGSLWAAEELWVVQAEVK